jgi:excisionase family DNA binding protein
MELLTYAAAADFLGIKRGTLYAWVHEGRIPHVRFSERCVRFDRAELEAWVEKRRVKATHATGRRP